MRRAAAIGAGLALACAGAVVGCGSDVQAGKSEVRGETSAESEGVEIVEVASEVEPEVLVEVAPEVDEVAPEVEDEVVAETIADTEEDTRPVDVAPEVVCPPCDDGLDCTDDACGADGVCTHLIRSGYCAIDGACVASGEPAGACRVCDPKASQTELTSRTEGSCDDGNVCTLYERCDLGVCGGGEAVICDRPTACQISEGCIPEAGGCITTGLADGTPCGADHICSAEQCVAGDSLPTGTVAWFDRGACPSGWVTYAFANGRTLVPAEGAGIGNLDGSALAPGQEPMHGHSASVAVTPGSVSFAGIAGCCNNSPAGANQVTVSGSLAAASSGLPYIQLLACRKTAALAVGTVPAHIRFFYDGKLCPLGSEPTTDSQGRVEVASPDGGASGVAFGGDSLVAAHHHRVVGALATPAAGIALASSGGAGGYASSNGLAFDLDSSDSGVAFPWRGERECHVGESAGTLADGAPSGLVVFVDGGTCPSGFVPFAAGRGRIFVGTNGGATVGGTVGTPLGDREDRTHVHVATLGATLVSKSIAGASGGNQEAAAAGNLSGTFVSEAAGSGLPFFQLLACKKP